MPTKLRVLLLDEHPVVRVGVRVPLENSGKFRIVGEANDVATARRLVEKLQPDLIVLDLFIGGRDGPELIEDLLGLQPSLLILVFTSLPEADYAQRVLRAGAHGYVMKHHGLEVVQAALEKIGRGEYAFSDTVHQTFVARVAGKRSDNPLAFLSNRELQIFRLLGCGMGSAEIAAELHLGIKTIGTYRERLKNKLNLQTARELERMAHSYVRPRGAMGAARAKAAVV